jgi:hypothetical protein
MFSMLNVLHEFTCPWANYLHGAEKMTVAQLIRKFSAFYRNLSS